MNRWGKWGRILGTAALASGLAMAGCGKKDAPGTAETAKPGPAAQANQGNIGTTVPVTSVSDGDRLHQSFAEATRNADNPPPDEDRPPDVTMTDKPTFKILQEVQKRWDGIRFTTPAGKRINHTATIETDFGSIEIEFKPDVAPNHVRNFIALAQAGYYDKLLFDRIHHEISDAANDPSPLKLDMIEGGCPVGSGHPASGSIGYWLKPEFSAKEVHEPGTIGACHGMEPDSAGTRFYIVLGNTASNINGNYTVFAKVKRGLDVVRKIAEQPVVEDENEPSSPSRRPARPIVIKKVTIKNDAGSGGES